MKSLVLVEGEKIQLTGPLTPIIDLLVTSSNKLVVTTGEVKRKVALTSDMLLQTPIIGNPSWDGKLLGSHENPKLKKDGFSVIDSSGEPKTVTWILNGNPVQGTWIITEPRIQNKLTVSV